MTKWSTRLGRNAVSLALQAGDGRAAFFCLMLHTTSSSASQKGTPSKGLPRREPDMLGEFLALSGIEALCCAPQAARIEIAPRQPARADLEGASHHGGDDAWSRTWKRRQRRIVGDAASKPQHPPSSVDPGAHREICNVWQTAQESTFAEAGTTQATSMEANDSGATSRQESQPGRWRSDPFEMIELATDHDDQSRPIPSSTLLLGKATPERSLGTDAGQGGIMARITSPRVLNVSTGAWDDNSVISHPRIPALQIATERADQNASHFQSPRLIFDGHPLTSDGAYQIAPRKLERYTIHAREQTSSAGRASLPDCSPSFLQAGSNANCAAGTTEDRGYRYEV